jgi:hypothetical protein
MHSLLIEPFFATVFSHTLFQTSHLTGHTLFSHIVTLSLSPQSRVAEFSRWLATRPERLFVLVGHHTFWYHFTNKQKHLKNCEVHVMSW